MICMWASIHSHKQSALFKNKELKLFRTFEGYSDSGMLPVMCKNIRINIYTFLFCSCT